MPLAIDLPYGRWARGVIPPSYCRKELPHDLSPYRFIFRGNLDAIGREPLVLHPDGFLHQTG